MHWVQCQINEYINWKMAKLHFGNITNKRVFQIARIQRQTLVFNIDLRTRLSYHHIWSYEIVTVCCLSILSLVLMYAPFFSLSLFHFFFAESLSTQLRICVQGVTPLPMRRLWGTVSNAFEKSSTAMSTCSHLSILVYKSYVVTSGTHRRRIFGSRAGMG